MVRCAKSHTRLPSILGTCVPIDRLRIDRFGATPLSEMSERNPFDYLGSSQPGTQGNIRGPGREPEERIQLVPNRAFTLGFAL